MTAAEVIERWFSAHAAGDLDAARSLLAPDAIFTAPDGKELRGFDEFMGWYQARRAAEGPTFSYEVADLLGGERHAAAVIRLSRGSTTWRQVAVFEVAAGRIAGARAYEDEPS